MDLQKNFFFNCFNFFYILWFCQSVLLFVNGKFFCTNVNILVLELFGQRVPKCYPIYHTLLSVNRDTKIFLVFFLLVSFSAPSKMENRYVMGSYPTLPSNLGNRLLDCSHKLSEYEEPYQALKYAQYFSYNTVVMEMKDMMQVKSATPRKSSIIECRNHRGKKHSTEKSNRI